MDIAERIMIREGLHFIWLLEMVVWLFAGLVFTMLTSKILLKLLEGFRFIRPPEVVIWRFAGSLCIKNVRNKNSSDKYRETPLHYVDDKNPTDKYLLLEYLLPQCRKCSILQIKAGIIFD